MLGLHIREEEFSDRLLGEFLQIWKLFDNSAIVNDIADNKINGTTISITISINVKHDHNTTSIGSNYSNFILKDQDIILMNITTS